MTLNCLTCRFIMDGNMSDSENEYCRGECCGKLCCAKVRRRCQWNVLTYKQMRIGSLNNAEKLIKKSYRRNFSTGAVAFGGGGSTEPRLLRSCAMRRDWSFEDMRGG
ncbi:uncharacterized protein LOC132174132 [Corylus avellana]|uniref:uncharacterized protein LOC132174132 n=1 Tax=Corylus avellana TaxID=13451 RepID=UPI001E201031|nr:uncharacterized protein LOC132174132 [Corylus avellana]